MLRNIARILAASDVAAGESVKFSASARRFSLILARSLARSLTNNDGNNNNDHNSNGPSFYC